MEIKSSFINAFLGDRTWRGDKKIFDRNIAILESFTESIPSVFVYSAIGSSETWFNYGVVVEIYGYWIEYIKT